MVAQGKGNAKAKAKGAAKKRASTASKKGGAKKVDNFYPSDTKVDEHTRFKGKVTYFNKSGGFGFIEPSKANVTPDNKVMVYWKEIKSDDAWPFLYKDLEVEFQLAKFVKANGQGIYIKAKEVTLPHKKAVNLQDEIDSKREFIHSKQTRFTGVVKFYDVKKGFGYVTMEDGYAGVDHVPKELRVVRSQIRAAGEAPFLQADLKVEFGIVKNLKENWSCYSLTLPGGDEISRATVEGRHAEGNAKYHGHVAFYDFRNGFGYVKPDSSKFPAKIQKLLDESNSKAKARLEKQGKDKKASALESLIYFRRSDCNHEGRINRGDKMDFNLYTDKRGVGAHHIKVSAA